MSVTKAEVIPALEGYLLAQHNAWRLQYANDPDILFKINVHIPAVTQIAREAHPDDPLVAVAALWHDYGRVFQYQASGNFNDGEPGSETDHHTIGYRKFRAEAESILRNAGIDPNDTDQAQSVINAIAYVIKYHGIGNYGPADLGNMPKEAFDLIPIISMIDDIANGTQCTGYLLRECQEKCKNVSKGGFIPDKNADSLKVTPRVMDLLRESKSFDRNTECQTYADYCVFATFLTTRILNGNKTEMQRIVLKALEQPNTVIERNADNSLTSRAFDDTVSALRYIYNRVMCAEDAEEVYAILQSFIKQAEDNIT